MNQPPRPVTPPNRSSESPWEEFAARIGRTPESVSNIERGLPLLSVELRQASGIPASEFLEGIERTETPRSAKRIETEVRLREIARELSDHGLTIAVAQADILLRERLVGLTDGTGDIGPRVKDVAVRPYSAHCPSASVSVRAGPHRLLGPHANDLNL